MSPRIELPASADATKELSAWEDDGGSLGYEEELMAQDFFYKVEG